MASQQLNIRISEEEHQHLENLALQTEGILTKQAVARLLIKYAIATGWEPLTASDTLVERRGDTPARVGPLSETSKAVYSSSSSLKEKRDKSKNKAAKYVFSVPPSLDAVKDKLIEFWRDYKDGKKTRAAGGMLITGCQAILDKYGLSVLQEQIDLACANNWQSITLKGYEQFGLVSKKGYAAAEPQYKHPAYRDAADVLAESDRIAQQNLEHLRRKQEESEPATGPLADLF